MSACAPALRFKRSDGSAFPDWEKCELQDIGKRSTEKNKARDLLRVFTNSAVQGVIDQRDFFDKDIANVDNVDLYYVTRLGDFIYNPRISTSAPVGPIKRNDLGDGVMSPLYTVFRIESGVLDFYSQYFESRSWHHYMNSVANYGARHDRMAISSADFMSMPLPAPSIDEQKEISLFLGLIDKRMSSSKNHLKMEESFKKGLMQKLFSQEIRFTRDDGSAFPDWVDVKLSEVLVELSEKTKRNNQHPALSSTMRGIVFQDDYFKGSPSSEDTTGYKVINKGEMTYRSFSDTGEFTFNTQSLIDKGIVSPAYPVFMISSCQNDIYIRYAMNDSNAFKRQIRSLRSGGTRLALPFSRLSGLSLMLPSIEEQQKIATCLTALDDKITATRDQIAQLETFKQGLLQKMFV